MAPELFVGKSILYVYGVLYETFRYVIDSSKLRRLLKNLEGIKILSLRLEIERVYAYRSIQDYSSVFLCHIWLHLYGGRKLFRNESTNNTKILYVACKSEGMVKLSDFVAIIDPLKFKRFNGLSLIFSLIAEFWISYLTSAYLSESFEIKRR